MQLNIAFKITNKFFAPKTIVFATELDLTSGNRELRETALRRERVLLPPVHVYPPSHPALDVCGYEPLEIDASKSFRGRGPAGLQARRGESPTLATQSTRLPRRASLHRNHRLGGRRESAVPEADEAVGHRRQRRLRSSLQMSVYDALRGIRIERASEEMASTELPLKEIAPLFGFRDMQRMNAVSTETAAPPAASAPWR